MVNNQEDRQIHELVLKRLDSIDEKFGIQNGKVARAEAGIIELGHTTKDLLRSITADAERIKKLEDTQTKEREEELAALRKRDVAFRERLIWGIVVVILFILGFVGILNVDFIKTII